jgi:hypothetical protein
MGSGVRAASVNVDGIDEIAAIVGSVTPSIVSVSAERGLAYCPAIRPTRITGFLAHRGADAHLEQDLQLLRDRVRVAVLEALRTVPTLDQEGAPALRFGKLRLEFLDFPGGDERRQATQFREHALDARRIRIGRLLRAGLMFQLAGCQSRGGRRVMRRCYTPSLTGASRLASPCPDWQNASLPSKRLTCERAT